MPTTKVLQVIIKARDQASKQLKGIGDASGKTGGMMSKLKTAGKVAAVGFALAAAGAAAAAKYIDGAITAAADYGKEVINIKRFTGASVEDSSVFAAILGRVGVTGNKATLVLKTLSTQIYKNNKLTQDRKALESAMVGADDKTRKALEKKIEKIKGASSTLRTMGIATMDSTGKTRSQIEVFKSVADWYSKTKDKSKGLALASQVLGRGFGPLGKVLSKGAKGIEAWAKTAKDAGLILTGQSVKDISKYNEALAENAEYQKGFQVQTGLTFMPLKTAGMKFILKLMKPLREMGSALFKILGPALKSFAAGFGSAFSGKNKTSVESVAKAVGKFAKDNGPAIIEFGRITGKVIGTAILWLGKLIGWYPKLGKSIGNFVYSASTQWRIFVDKLMTVAVRVYQWHMRVIGYFVAIPRRIGGAVNTAVAYVGRMPGRITTALSGLKGRISNAISGAWGAFTSLPGKAYQWGRNMLASFMRGVRSIKIKLPHFTVSGRVTRVAGIPIPTTLPKFGVKWYGNGGVFTKPSVIGVGERGPEAVVPLNKMKAVGGGVNFYGDIYVRDDSDIDAIADAVSQALFNSQRRDALAVGNA